MMGCLMTEKESNQVQKPGSEKPEWKKPECNFYGSYDIIKGGANLRTSDDVIGDNYKVS